jgi:hypothetical protein
MCLLLRQWRQTDRRPGVSRRPEEFRTCDAGVPQGQHGQDRYGRPPASAADQRCGDHRPARERPRSRLRPRRSPTRRCSLFFTDLSRPSWQQRSAISASILFDSLKSIPYEAGEGILMHRSDGPHSRRALHSSIVHDYCGLLRDALRQSPYHPGDVRESVEFLVLHKLNWDTSQGLSGWVD